MITYLNKPPANNNALASDIKMLQLFIAFKLRPIDIEIINIINIINMIPHHVAQRRIYSAVSICARGALTFSIFGSILLCGSTKG